MAFTKDIFISYAHIDNESLLEGDKGWISEFQRSLEIRLGQLYGRKPVIWRDQKLTGNDQFDNEIIDQLPQVKFMISIVSPRYLKSEWCLKEITAFHQACEKNVGFSVKNKTRLFKIIKTPVKVDNYPDVIRDQLGYEFFETDPDTGRAHEFSQIFGDQAQRLYWSRLDDLAHDITYMLEEMDTLINDPDSGHQPSKEYDTSKTIYLSETTNDLKKYRDEFKRELLAQGFNILPDHTLPLEGPEFRKDVSHFLNQSDLCIQMLGSNYGIVPEGENKSIVALQQELAVAESTHTKLDRMIWIPGFLEDIDPRQFNLIETITNENEELTGAEIITSGIEELKSIFKDKFRKKVVADPIEHLRDVSSLNEPEAEMYKEDVPPMVYLICTEEDLDSITPLEDFLFNQGYEVTLPVFEGDEDLIRQDNLENLRNCDSTIIYFGKANDLWIRSKVRDLIKIVGYGRKKPLKNKYVYIDEPVTRTKERFRSQGIHVVDGTNGFNEKLMSDFKVDQ